MVAPAGRLQVEDIASREVRPTIIPDPGNAGTFDVSRGGIIELTSVGAAETRTLPDPTFRGQQLDIYMIADGGDIVITASSPVNQTGHTTITCTAIGGFIRLVGKYNATDGWEWQEVMEDTGITTS
jgi:hypothetical protein